MVGRNTMTLEELRKYCEDTGQPLPARKPRKKGPRARLVLDFGEALGAATITVECEPSARARWRDWLAERKAHMGGELSG